MRQDFEIKDGILISYTGKESDITIPKEVTCIKNGCFENNSYIKRITIPYNVKRIKSDIFKECINLEEAIILSDTEKIPLRMFKNCKNLKKVTLGPNVKKIGLETFDNCEKLKEINLENIDIIDSYSFANCKELEYITFSNNIKAIGENAFVNSGLKAVKINNIMEIFEGAFNNCNKLEIIDIKYISKYEDTFIKECNNLKEVKIGTNKIGEVLIAMCPELEKIELYNPVTNEDVVFITGYNNPKLTEVTGPSIICENKIVYNKNRTELLVYLEGKNDKIFNIPNNIKLIRPYAIHDNRYLEKITLNNNLEIESHGIDNCEKLKEIIFDENINLTIRSVSNCKELKKIDLSKTSIKKYNSEYITNTTDENLIIKLPKSVEEIEATNKNTQLYTYQKPKIIKGYKENIQILNLNVLIDEHKSILEANKILKEYQER